MRDAFLTAICALALLEAGCTSKPASQGPCGPGETPSSVGSFCYKVPEGFKQKGEPQKREGWVDTAFASDDRASIHFIVRDPGGFDSIWKALSGNAAKAKAADAAEKEFAGGKGKLITYTTPEKDARFIVSALMQGTKNDVECEAEYRVSAPHPEIVEACTSIREP